MIINYIIKGTSVMPQNRDNTYRQCYIISDMNAQVFNNFIISDTDAQVFSMYAIQILKCASVQLQQHFSF
jgi:cAMP phosphodiesterase